MANGEFFCEIQMMRTQNQVSIVFKNQAERTIEFFKLTEAQYGTECLESIEADTQSYSKEQLKELHQKSRMPVLPEFLVLGDSITCGYGVLDTKAENSGRSQTESAWEAWAVQSIRELGYRPILLAFSGKGLVQNYDLQDPNTIPLLYKKTAPESGGLRTTWPNNIRAVAIHLGTNDFAHFAPDSALFEEMLHQLINGVRTEWSAGVQEEIPVFLLMGPLMHDNQINQESGEKYNARQLLRNNLKAVAQKEPQVHFFEFSEDLGERGVGAMWHPSLETQKFMSSEILPFLKGIL